MTAFGWCILSWCGKAAALLPECVLWNGSLCYWLGTGWLQYVFNRAQLRSVTVSKHLIEEYNLHEQTGNSICLNVWLLISKAPPNAWNMLMKLIYCYVNWLIYLEKYVEALHNIYLSIELCCQALMIVEVRYLKFHYHVQIMQEVLWQKCTILLWRFCWWQNYRVCIGADCS